MDFFGLNKVYNYMGTCNSDNWKLRLTPQYEKDYYKTVENRSMDKMALNMPELLSLALKSKLSWNELKNEGNNGENQKIKSLIDKLSHFGDVLYEKS